MTRRGKLLIVEGVLLYGLARGVAIDELYALAIAAILFPVLAMGFVRLRRHEVTVSRAVAPRRLFAGGTARLTYSILNAGRSTSPPLILEDAVEGARGGRVRVALPSLSPERRGQVSVERRMHSRGRYRIGPLHAHIEDPFGLASMPRQAEGASSVTVYPPIEVLHEAMPRDPRAGAGRSLAHRLAIAGDEFYAIRDWQDGDDLRKVHWRSTARRGSLQIRQDEIRPYPRGTVVLDARAAVFPAGSADAFEWMLSAAASVIWELARLGFGLRLATPEVTPRAPRWGREAADPLLSALAITKPSPIADVRSLTRGIGSSAGAGGLLFAILPPDADAAAALARARNGYGWAGAVLMDVGSFVGVTGRQRAVEDQRLAHAARTLQRTGWRVATAGTTDRFTTLWQRLTDAGASRPSSLSRHL